MPLAIQHTTRLFPTSHVRGRNQIDYTLISSSLLYTVVSTGVLPQSSLFHGHHRPHYVDFNSNLVFGDPAYDVALAHTRSLRLHDPRIVGKYIATLRDHLDSHNVFPQLEELVSTLQAGQWTAAHTAEYEALDNIVTTAMLHSEKTARRRISTKYNWSPPLKQAVQCLRYWLLELRQSRNLPVSSQQLEWYKSEGHVDDNPLQTTTEIDSRKRDASQSLRKLQAQHQQLREGYLESLAEAIVLQYSPQLDQPSMAFVRKERVEK